MPMDAIGEDFDHATRAFFGSVYDFKEDNRAKNRIILGLMLVFLLQSAAFFVYVQKHARVHVRVVDTNLAENLPFRVLAFDAPTSGQQALYRYFFGLITSHLFTYDKSTLIENRKMISHFLSPTRIKGLEHNTDELIAQYAKYGRFQKGNPRARVRNVILLSDTEALKVVQAFVQITMMDEGGGLLEEGDYIVTFKFRNREPADLEAVTKNPLGIMVTEWVIQENTKDTK